MRIQDFIIARLLEPAPGVPLWQRRLDLKTLTLHTEEGPSEAPPCPTLRLLAQRWSHHIDFDDRWST